MVQGPEQQKLFGPAVAIAPMNRMGEPEEIADACLFLCSSKATFVQGAALVRFIAILLNLAKANFSRSLMAAILLISLYIGSDNQMCERLISKDHVDR